MKNVINTVRALAVVLCSFTLMSANVVAADDNSATNSAGYKPDKIKNEVLVITLGADHCVQSIAPDVDNCALAYTEETNPCKNKKDCICSKKDKNITWKTMPATTFEIRFSESTTEHKKPFDGCNLKPDSGSQIDCKVQHKGEYTYDVYVKGCLAKPYDPVIIIR